MPINYNVIPNALTSPPSYTARPTPQVIHDYDSLARQINIHNPTIPAATAKSVLEAFREEVIYQLAEGNSVNLKNFVSFVVSMPVRLATPTDTLPSSPVNVKAKPSVTLKTEVDQAATYSQQAFVTKAPNIINAADSNLELADFFRPGYGVRVDGTFLGFDASDSELGVNMLSPAQNIIPQTNLSLNEPSKVIFVGVLDEAAGPAGDASVEYQLSITNRYTANGQSRIGTYSRFLRCANVTGAAAADAYIFVTGQDATGPAAITAYTGSDEGTYIVVSELKPTGELVLSAGSLQGEFGPQVEVTDDGVYVLNGIFEGVTPITISVTVISKVDLTAATDSYGRYLQEVCTITETV